MGTPFEVIYNCFLGKVTDDMFFPTNPDSNWTKEDLMKDLENILLDAIPLFEFPLFDLYDYGEVEIDTPIDDDCCCIIRDLDNPPEKQTQMQYNCELTPEEINILAVLMYNTWLQRQIASIENTRMKYSGTDFKLSSQSNHLDKLMKLKQEAERQAHHLQRLYKRRRMSGDKSKGKYKSNWSSVMEKSVFGDNPVP